MSTGPGTGRGFTLIELLIVVLVVGIALSLVTLGVTSDANRLEAESKRLAALLEHAALRARTTGLPLAWQRQERGYRFLAHEDAWHELPDSSDEVLRARQLPDGIALQLLAPDRLPAPEADGAATIVFPATGLAQPFDLRLAGTANDAFRIAGDANGRVSIGREATP